MRWSWLLLLPLAVMAADRPSESDDLQTLANGRVAADGPSLIRYFRQRTVSAAEREEITALIRNLGDLSCTVRERASESLIARGLPAIAVLRQAMSDPDVEIARRAEKCLKAIEQVPGSTLSTAVVRMTARRKPDGASEVLLAYLPLAEDSAVVDEIRETLAALAIQNGRIDSAIEKQLESKNAMLRGIAAEALIRAGHTGARRLVTDPDYGVRLRVTLAAVEHAHDKGAVPHLINMLSELPPATAWQAEEALIRIAGDESPQVSLGRDDAGRWQCRDAWQAWWKQHGNEIDLSKTDGNRKWHGLTLIVQADMRNALGRVSEINSNKEVQWKIENLKAPRDAVVVGDNRVLIAEWLTGANSGQVSLRDFQGNVIWRKDVTNPMSIQALPGGHVLVSTRTESFELDENQKEVFKSPPREEFDLIGALKQKNGEYVYITTTKCFRLIPGQEPKSFPLSQGGPPTPWAGFDLLPNGGIIVTRASGVVEYDSQGKKGGFETRIPVRPSSVQRLPNGNTLICSSIERKVIEVDRNGSVTWEYPITEMQLQRARRR